MWWNLPPYYYIQYYLGILKPLYQAGNPKNGLLSYRFSFAVLDEDLL